MDRDRRMENGNGQRNRERNIGQVQVQDQGEVYIQREMDRKTDGDRGKNILKGQQNRDKGAGTEGDTDITLIVSFPGLPHLQL